MRGRGGLDDPILDDDAGPHLAASLAGSVRPVQWPSRCPLGLIVGRPFNRAISARGSPTVCLRFATSPSSWATGSFSWAGLAYVGSIADTQHAPRFDYYIIPFSVTNEGNERARGAVAGELEVQDAIASDERDVRGMEAVAGR